MKILALGSILVVALACPGRAVAAERLPVEAFARSPDLSDAQLSPDGECMGYIFTHEGRGEISFLDLKTGKAAFLSARALSGRTLQVADFLWVGDTRVVAATTIWGSYFTGLASVSRSASRWLGLTGLARMGSFKGSPPTYASYVLYASGRDPSRVVLLDEGTTGDAQAFYPDVAEIDALTGSYRRVLTNSGDVLQWLPDWDGNICFGLKRKGNDSYLIWRENSNSAWHEPTWDEPASRTNLLGLNPTATEIYLTKVGANGRWGLFTFNPGKGQLSEPLLQHALYDIAPRAYNPSYAGVGLAGGVFSPKSHDLIGVRYVTEGPQQIWFDPVRKELQRKIDAQMPNLSNMIVSTDLAENRMLVLSWSDREPGIYSLVDLGAHQTRVIGRSMPWIKPEQMAPMYPIECKARDGLALHGYLTVPLGAMTKNLPLVMMVHGGPWVRDVWGFDPVVQFLANRGYAVLQINYRGSVGYGADFEEKARGQVGGTIQDDVADAVRWAIQTGIANPRRVAIMGASYGGYSTLFALAKTPDLYRCGIDFAGVTDWPAIARNAEKEEYKYAYAHWVERLGDFKEEATLLRYQAVSPINFAREITAPLLIIHGESDGTVPFSQSTAMVSALKKAGHGPETLYIKDLGHTVPKDKDGEVFLNKIEAFLAANLGP